MTWHIYRNQIDEWRLWHRHTYNTIAHWTLRHGTDVYEFTVKHGHTGALYCVVKAGAPDWSLTGKAALDFVLECGIPISEIPTDEDAIAIAKYVQEAGRTTYLMKEIDELSKVPMPFKRKDKAQKLDDLKAALKATEARIAASNQGRSRLEELLSYGGDRT